MAKKIRRILALVLVLTLCMAQLVTPAYAKRGGDDDDERPGSGNYDWNRDDDDDDDDDERPGSGTPGGNTPVSGYYEWYQVYVQDTLVASGQGSYYDVYFLGTHYVADAYADGHMLYWYIDPQGSDNYFDGQVDLSKYITIPEGFSINDIQIDEASIGGVNDPVYNMYDNAVIRITIKALKDESGGVVEVPEETDVAVIHNYYTKDLYTGDTVKDGTVPSYAGATEGETFTATAIPTYNGNTYTQTGVTPDMTITVDADASKNVINIDYLRTIDTTPKQTSVTVNHTYYTKDLYTGDTVLDGSTSGTQSGKERDVFTATAVTSYAGKTYTQTTDASALTITVVADASKNVINIDYLRTIDTTPADTSVTVNHNYYTKDLYTGQTVLDGSTTGTQAAKERDIFTATPASSYNGNLYTQTTDASALTITVVADAGKNVINIDYLRTIDTTPAKTSVTVNHNYYTKDLYTGQTVLDGSGSENYGATEKDTFTATAVTSFNGNAYTRTTDDGLLTITVKADASKNVINIDYLRTIDTTPVDYAPTISIVKTAAAAEYEVGETITWIITVTNTSAYTAYDVTVTDELVNGSWSIDILEAGGSRTLTTTSVAAEEGTVKNVVVASWTDNDDIPDNEEPEEPKTTSDEETVTVSTPVPEGGTPVALDDEYPIEEPTDPAPPASTNPPVYYDYSDGSVEIPDEDVPLADVPKTGDLSFLWAAISLLSAGSAIALTKKRREN